MDLIDICECCKQPVFKTGKPDLVSGGLRLVHEAKIAYWHGTRVRLTNKEWDVLELIASRSPRAVSVDALNIVLFPDGEGNSQQVLISRIRRKFREAGCPNVIYTRHRVGYMLDTAEAMSQAA